MPPLKPKAKSTAITTATAAGTAGASKRRPKLKWRTRDSQNSQLYNLQLDINDLQQEIQQLQQAKSILLMQTRLNRMDDRDGSYVKVVREYHRVFQHGFQPVVTLAASSHSDEPRTVDTMEFLSRVMDERVSIGRFVGLDMMRDQWTRYSRAFSNLELRHVSSMVLPQMDYVTPSGAVRPVAMVSSKATYESVFTVETMELMFPHLLERHRSVLEKLLGRTFSGIGDFDFVFDTNSHRVIGYDFRLDVFAAFARLLHDPEDLCLLFEGAKISEEFLIGDLNVYPQVPTSSSGCKSAVTADQRAAGATIAEVSDTEQRAWATRSIDPVVLKYATRRAEQERTTHSQELHSKLTSILDPVDREELGVPVAPAEPLPQPPSCPRLPSLVHDRSNRNQPWQLQMPGALPVVPAIGNTDAPLFSTDHAPHTQSVPMWQSMPPSCLPSVPYFPASALSRDGHSGSSAQAKRATPFASAHELLVRSHAHSHQQQQLS